MPAEVLTQPALESQLDGSDPGVDAAPTVTYDSSESAEQISNQPAASKSVDKRYYTLIWDSADVLGFEEKQARARLWHRSNKEEVPSDCNGMRSDDVEDAGVLYLCFDYMDTLNNLGSGVMAIATETALIPRSQLGRRVAKALRLSPVDALMEVEWPDEERSQWLLKQHFIDKFGQLWLVRASPMSTCYALAHQSWCYLRSSAIFFSATTQSLLCRRLGKSSS